MKILTLDIETSPHNGYAFGVWQQNIAPGQIIKPTYMLTWAAKWLGDPQSATEFRQFRDEDFLSKLYAMLSAADAIVTYNGDKFDMRHINRELVEAGYPRPRPCAQIDMLKVVKKMFLFPHNRLDYVCSVLLGATKLQTGGFDLWPSFMDGCEKAVRVMTRYNKKDVVLTERLYKKLRGWIPNHPHVGPVDGSTIDDGLMTYTCPACGSAHVTKMRPRRTRCFAIRVLQCQTCGNISDGKRKKL